MVLAFVTAECERLFSKLGYIKNNDINRLEDILNELILIYNANEVVKEAINSEKITKLDGKWDKDKTDKTPWSERYAMSIV